MNCLNYVNIFCYFSLTNKVVALKEIRLQQEEGAPFTAIREGITTGWPTTQNIYYCNRQRCLHFIGI